MLLLLLLLRSCALSSFKQHRAADWRGESSERHGGEGQEEESLNGSGSEGEGREWEWSTVGVDAALNQTTTRREGDHKVDRVLVRSRVVAKSGWVSHLTRCPLCLFNFHRPLTGTVFQ